MISLYALSLVIMISPPPAQDPFPTENLLHQPLVELLGVPNVEGESLSELKAVRSALIDEKDRKIQELRELERTWKRKLDLNRQELQALNRLGSQDTEATAKKRSDLHMEIASLERVIRDNAAEREHTIPAVYELKLTKLWLSQHWPERREKIRQQVEDGLARERRHGNAEDIGYRSVVKNQEEDLEAGQRAARQMVAGGWLPFEVPDNEVQVYVRKLASKIAANSDLKVPLHLTVLDSRELKAIALPGGYLYVTSGVIRAARSESELAGVLSREIARIAARHATRSSKVSLFSRVFVPLTQVATSVFTAGAVSPAAYYGIGYGVEGLSGLLQSALNGTSEKLEKEADQLGIQYAWKAGYDPRGFVSFLDSISETKHNSFLKNEPLLQERLLNCFSEIEYLPAQKEPVNDIGEFDRIRQRLAD